MMSEKIPAKNEEPPKKEEPKKDDNEELLKEILTDLKEGVDADFSFLGIKEQIKAYRELKKKQPKAPAQNPAVPPAEPSEDKFETIMERNKTGGKWWEKNILERMGVKFIDK